MKTRVLVADDKADVRKLLRMTLDSGDFEVYEAGTGAGALEMIERARPAVMLLDIMMPGEIDGLEVCRRTKSDPVRARIAVIMLTARGQQSDIAAAKAAGADAYLVKPFSPLELLDTLGRFAKQNG